MKQNSHAVTFLFAEQLVWSFFPIITVLLFTALPPLLIAGISTLIAGVFFALYISFKGTWAEFSGNIPWKDALLGSFFIGFLFFGLNFYALQHTTVGNHAIIFMIEIPLTYFLMAFVFKSETWSSVAFTGSLLMMVGGAITLFNGVSGINYGDIITILASPLAPIGNFYAKRAFSKGLSTHAYMFIRSVFAGIGLFLLGLLFLSDFSVFLDLTSKDYAFLFINGVFIMGISKIFFMEGMKRSTVSFAISFFALGPPMTLFWAWLILNEAPTGGQIFGIIPILFGIYVLTHKKSA